MDWVCGRLDARFGPRKPGDVVWHPSPWTELALDFRGSVLHGGVSVRGGAWAWQPLRTRADLRLLCERVDFAVQLSGDPD